MSSPLPHQGTTGRRAWAFIAAAVLCEVTASVSLKLALTSPVLYVVVALGYGAAFSALTLAIRAGLGLGVAYGTWGAAGVALTAVVSSVLFQEPLTLLMVIGIALVICGVLCVEAGSQPADGSTPATAHGSEGAA